MNVQEDYAKFFILTLNTGLGGKKIDIWIIFKLVLSNSNNHLL